MRTHEQRWMLAAELGLLALALGTAAGFTRLFIGWDFLERLLPLLSLAWAVPLLLRRAGVPVLPALLGHLVVGVVTLTAYFAPGTHLFGIPSGHTVTTLSRSISTSFAEFSELVAPVPATDGFLVVAAAGLWVFAFFADAAALRYRGPAQAALPYLSLFLALGVLARASGRTTATVCFGLGLLVYVTTQLGRSALDRRWVAGHERRGARSAATQAAVLGVVALAAGMLLTPLLPGGTEPVVDLRQIGRGAGPRTVVSPFVGIRSLLGQRSDQVVFTVVANEPSYWRLTALEEFDEARQIWVSSGTYLTTGQQLPTTDHFTLTGAVLQQQFHVEGLGGPWLPGAFVPVWIDSGQEVGFDQRSSSLILRDDVEEGPVAYRLDSMVPDYAHAIAAPFPSRSTDVDDVHFHVPPLSGVVQRAIEDATAAGGSDYDRMLALQNWFRSRFAYDEGVDYSGEGEPLEAFLEQRRGFCQQFSSAFALMARWLGLPSRVAVGFTPGDPTADGRFVVRGRHAHAWPEVHLPGVGWVPFEPTPQRGDPQSVQHTGVAPSQAAPPPADRTTTTEPAPGQSSSTTQADAPPTRPMTAEQTTRDAAGGSGGDTARQPGTGEDDTPVAVVIGTAFVLVVLLAVWGWWRYRGARAVPGPAGSPARLAVGGAWAATTRALARRSLGPSQTETPLEYARRVVAEVMRRATGEDDTGGEDAERQLQEFRRALLELGEIETRARYGPTEPSPDDVTRATAAAATVQSSSVLRNLLRAREPALPR